MVISSSTDSSRSRFRHESRETVRTYDELKNQGVNPSVPIILAALKSCISSRDFATGTRIHTDLIASAAAPNIYISNTLLDMYCKCGRLEDASRVFESMQHRNLVSWNTVIMGFAHKGQSSLALDLFSRMRSQGLEPNSRTFVAAIKACTSLLVVTKDETRSFEQKVGCLKVGMEIHKQAERLGHDSDAFVGSCIVDLYAKCGRMAEARKAFERMKIHDVVSWTALISGYAQKGDGKKALEMFDRMQEDGIQPNALTFGAAVNACGKLAMEADQGGEGELFLYLEKGRDLHRELAKLGYESDVFVASGLVDMYSNCGSIREAKVVFDRMKKRDVVSWNAMILGTAQCGDGDSALKLFRRMQEEGFVANSRSFVAVLNSCSSLATIEEGRHVQGKVLKVVSLEKGRSLHAEAERRSYTSVIFVANSLVDMYAKCGSMTEARKVFDGIRKRNLFSWTVIIMGYAQNDDGEEAVKLYNAMKQDLDEEGKRFQPNSQTFMAILKAYGALAALEAGKSVHDEIREGDLERNPMLACSLIGFYGRCGSTDEAQKVFDAVPDSKRDAAVWSALIAAYGLVGDVDRVFEVFERMVSQDLKKVRPDGVTFLSVLAACSHAGLVERGKEYFQMMSSVKFGLVPGVEHYTCLVDLLSRANQLDEAVSTVGRMPQEASYVVWMSVLGGCKKWKNVEVGRIAFERLLELDAEDGAAYVAMLNLYSSLGMWEESYAVEKMRSELKVVNKFGECCWSDEVGIVHKFWSTVAKLQ